MRLDLIQAPRFNKIGVFASLEPYIRSIAWRRDLSPGMMQLATTGPRTWSDWVEAAKKTTNVPSGFYGVEETCRH